MFTRILHANDGSEHAFNALALALKIAKHSGAELHMISVEEIDYLPERMEDVREERPGSPHAGFMLSSTNHVQWPKSRRSSSRPTWLPAIPCATSWISRATSRPICW